MEDERRDSTRAAHNDKSAVLARTHLFQNLQEAVRGHVANYSVIRAVPRGRTIFSKGDDGSALFVVSDGVVQMSVPSLEGKSAVYNHIGAGEVFGEIALLDGSPRSTDAIAFTDCTLVVIERRYFLQLLHDHSEIAMRVIELLCSRIRRTSQQVEDLMFLDLKRRVAKTLLVMSSGSMQELAITQGDLSQIVGMSREMINRQLQVWDREGWISLGRRRIGILRPDRLEQLLSEG